MRLIGCMIALLLLTAPAVVAQVDSAPDTAGGEEADYFDVSAVVEAHYPLTMALLEEEFPGDRQMLLQSFEEISGGEGSARDKVLAAFEQLKELRRRYADRLLFAPSASHAILLGLIADFHDTVLGNEGTSVCGRFAHDGSAVLFELGLSEKYIEHLDRQSLAYFGAVVAAIELPEDHGDLAPEDWNEVIAAMVAAGAPPSYVSTIVEGRPNDPNLCPALAAMFRTSGLLDSPAGARTRADFAKNLSGY